MDDELICWKDNDSIKCYGEAEHSNESDITMESHHVIHVTENNTVVLTQ